MMSSIRIFLLLLSLVSALMVPARASEPVFNRIAVIVDASGSFRSRQSEAIAKVDQLLQGLSDRKVKRWQQQDEIEVISLDAMPEVIWSGTPDALRTLGKEEWARRFRARSDYVQCTDVTAAFVLATKLLQRAPVPTESYIFGFSDLIAEPPMASMTHCRRPHALPGDGFPWKALRDVSVTMFWMPPNQKMAWSRAMTAHGLTRFRLLTSSESAANAIDIPKAAHHTVTPEEKARARKLVGEIFDWIESLALWAVGLVIGGTLVVIAIAFGLSRRAAAPQPARGHAVTRPVAPLRLPPRQP